MPQLVARGNAVDRDVRERPVVGRFAVAVDAAEDSIVGAVEHDDLQVRVDITEIDRHGP